MSAVDVSEPSSTTCKEEDEELELIQVTFRDDDNSIENDKEDDEDVEAIQEDTEDSEPFKVRMRSESKLEVAVKSLKRKSNDIKKEFYAEKERDFQNIPRQDTTIDFREGIDHVNVN